MNLQTNLQIPADYFSNGLSDTGCKREPGSLLPSKKLPTVSSDEYHPWQLLKDIKAMLYSQKIQS
jgi:hypothetical protein